MEYDKINNLLLSEDNESEQLSKFVTGEYVRVNCLLDTHNENESIRFKATMLRSNLCNYSDAYILVNAPFVSCMTKINNEFIEDADDLDIVMPMYNLFRI